jgi:1,4-dihydroxy-2-naphthoate octaprenyltransferase
MLDVPREISGPSGALAGPGAGAAVRRAIGATRPAFFVASISPVLVGTAWAAAAHQVFNPVLFALALAATVLVHAATNVWNDVGDDMNGADRDNPGRMYPYTGGSQFIQAGILSRAQMIRLAVGLAGCALLIGVLLAVWRGPGVIVLGLLGLALGLLYSMPGVQLSAHGIGEAAVAIGFGALPVLGAEWLQAGVVDWPAVVLCIPVSAWVAAILLINEVPDVEGDGRARKRTLVVRFGAEGARWIYAALTVAALTASMAAIKGHLLPPWYALPAVALAGMGTWAVTGISTASPRRSDLRRSIRVTLAIHTLGSVALLAAILSRIL